MYIVAAIFFGVLIAVGLGIRGMQDSMLYFRSPTEVLAGQADNGRTFRLGGMVRKGSVKRVPGDIEMTFDVTDYQHTITVHYSGVTPALFGEGQGVIAIGTMGDDHSFYAREVLAKHDEKYMPPEVADMLAKQNTGGDGKTVPAAN